MQERSFREHSFRDKPLIAQLALMELSWPTRTMFSTSATQFNRAPKPTHTGLAQVLHLKAPAKIAQTVS